MVTTRLYLDSRYLRAADSTAPVKLQITKKGRTALLSTGVYVLPDQWDRDSLKVVRHPAKGSINSFLARFQLQADEFIRGLVLSGEAARLTSLDIKDRLDEFFNGSSCETSFRDFVDSFLKKKSSGTILVYSGSIKMLKKYDDAAMSRSMSAFTRSWVEQFDSWLQEHYAPNSRKTCISNISAVFGSALDAGIIPSNPFKGLKLGFVQTRKRDLSLDQFRLLWRLSPENENDRKALDFFRFSFLTIAMNPADILALTESSVFNGRIDYDRLKTKRHYSIRIVPELESLLERYRSGGRLFNPYPGFVNKNSAISFADAKLSRLAESVGLPRISLYWARHTWASFASELDIPIDVISSALGHSHGAKVTMVYIHEDQRKVDEAARKVLDFALSDSDK